MLRITTLRAKSASCGAGWSALIWLSGDGPHSNRIDPPRQTIVNRPRVGAPALHLSDFGLGKLTESTRTCCPLRYSTRVSEVHAEAGAKRREEEVRRLTSATTIG